MKKTAALEARPENSAAPAMAPHPVAVRSVHRAQVGRLSHLPGSMTLRRRVACQARQPTRPDTPGYPRRFLAAPLGLVLLLMLATGARAQDKPNKADPAPAQKSPPIVDEGSKPAPVAEPDPAPVQGVRYRIELKSGSVLEGVIRARGVFERRAKVGGYESADENDKGSGVRIWFPSRQDGFIFMPLESVKRIDELGSLSVDEGRTIARARVAAKKRANGERVQLRAMRRVAEEAASRADADAVAAADEAEAVASVKPRPAQLTDEEAADERVLAALLITYPPTRWSPETPAEIQRRKVVLGLFPSDEETAFLGVFDDWLRAYNAWLGATDVSSGGNTSGEAGLGDGGDDEDASDKRRARRPSPRPRPASRRARSDDETPDDE